MFQTEWNTETFLRVQREEGFAIGLEQGLAQGIEQGIEQGADDVAEAFRLVKSGKVSSLEELLARGFNQHVAETAISLVQMS